MDGFNKPNTTSRFHRHRQPPTSDRFLGAYPNSSSSLTDNNTSSSAATTDDELNEDDIFTTDFSQTNHNHITPSTSSSLSASTPRNHFTTHKNNISIRNNYHRAEVSGILAALPEPSNNHRFYHKASLSTFGSPTDPSTLSSSRMIPTIPKPPQERIPHPASSSCGKFHQSAPVNVPLFAKAMRKHCEFDDVELDEDEEEGEMLPPHEIVARGSVQSPMLAYSVLEGVGRTLKGRDLRQVRNAIWRRTGFLD